MIDILLLAVIAGFILFRLRSVLGQRPDDEGRRPQNPFGGFGQPKQETNGHDNDDEDNVIELPGAERQRREEKTGPDLSEYILEGSAAEAGIKQIQTADNAFDVPEFINGGRYAYEMIVAAFAAGDMEALEPLLASDVLHSFKQVVDDRARVGETAQTSVVGIREAKVAGAEMKGDTAEVTIRFVTDMVSWIRDKNDEVVEGHDTATKRVTDIWTFARDTRSSNPNWQLVATGEG